MYSKFVIGRLVKRGYPALDAQKMVADKHPLAKEELLNESRERPVILNRAPSLHRFSVIAAYPKLVEGKTIKMSPFSELGLSSDYDGDAINVHAPITAAGIADAKKMTLSNLIFSDRKPGKLNVAPDMEAVLGLHRATSGASDAKTTHFKNMEAALAAYHSGVIGVKNKITLDS